MIECPGKAIIIIRKGKSKRGIKIEDIKSVNEGGPSENHSCGWIILYGDYYSDVGTGNGHRVKSDGEAIAIRLDGKEKTVTETFVDFRWNDATRLTFIEWETGD